MKLSSPIKPRKSRIVIIPLIDIMFFLLASFMMVSLQMSRTANIKVDLPSASQASQDYKPDMINVAVDKTGAVWLEKREISLAELSLVLSNRFRADTNLPVYISGDQSGVGTWRHGQCLSSRTFRRASRRWRFMTGSSQAGATP